jgi:hypothetical protein
VQCVPGIRNDLQYGLFGIGSQRNMALDAEYQLGLIPEGK